MSYLERLRNRQSGMNDTKKVSNPIEQNPQNLQKVLLKVLQVLYIRVRNFFLSSRRLPNLLPPLTASL